MQSPGNVKINGGFSTISGAICVGSATGASQYIDSGKIDEGNGLINKRGPNISSATFIGASQYDNNGRIYEQDSNLSVSTFFLDKNTILPYFLEWCN